MIQFSKPTLKRADMYNVLETMVRERIGPGECEEEFSALFASSTGCKSALTFRTYPDAIERALLFLGVRAGSRVALSVLAPEVYLDVFARIGCEPVFLDVDRENGLPSPDAVLSAMDEESLGEGERFLVLHDTAGSIAVGYDREISGPVRSEYPGMRILEDVSESIGSVMGPDGINAGSFGDVVVCALEEDSVISAGGGAVLSVRGGAEYAQESLKAFKSSRSSLLRYAKLADLNASLAIIQIQNIEADNTRRRQILSMYRNAMKSAKSRCFGLSGGEYLTNGSTFAVFMDSKPEDFISFAKKRGVPLKRTFSGAVIERLGGTAYERFPEAAAFYSRTVSFPVYPFLKSDEVDLVSKVVAAMP